MANTFEEIKSIYTNFIVSPDGETGELPLDEEGRWTLKAVKAENPDNWKVYDSVTKEPFTMPSRGIPAAMRMAAGEFICTYKDLMPKEIEPEPVKESYPIESREEPEQPQKTEWKVGGAKALTTKQPAKKAPLAIPEDVRNRQIMDLSFSDIKNYICPDANDSEAYMFLKLCQARNLNPFIGEAYLIKYGSDKAQMVVGKETFTRRAEVNPHIKGWKAGVIVRVKAGKDTPAGPLERREGAFILPEEELLGGWSKIFRDDIDEPHLYEVTLQEYIGKKRDGTISKMWREKPATMIRKDALVGGLRESAPSEFGGMYDQSEIEGGIIEADYEEVEA